MKQTAVEWLKNKIEEDSDTTFHNLNWDRFDELIEQAKEMEKEQIKKAWSDRVTKDYQFIYIDQKSAEQYFIENFKSA